MDTLFLPLVSIIIINYNYNDYLERAVKSALTQTYPRVEIIIVDDKSTDNSSETIDKICEVHPCVIPVKLVKNSGQSVASYQGLSKSSGAYVVLLDADDELLSECVEAHVYAHLSSRVTVAFSTVDIINSVAGQDVNASHPGFANYIESQCGQRPKAIRCVHRSMPNSWFGQRNPAIMTDQMHFVLPPHVDPWVWSPTSANCFRRDALEMLLKEPGLERIRWGTDAFVMRPLSGLFGSILIDRPLVRYIIHTTNRFVKSAPLNQYHFFDSRSTADDIRVMARSGLEKLMSDAEYNGSRYANPEGFFTAMKTLTECFPGPKQGEQPGEYYLQQLLKHEAALTKGFGAQVVADAIRKERVGWRRKFSHLLRNGPFK